MTGDSGMIAAQDQMQAQQGASMTDPVGAHYARLIRWGIEPQYAIQLAGALQSHLMAIEKYKVMHGIEVAENTASHDDAQRFMQALLSGQLTTDTPPETPA